MEAIYQRIWNLSEIYLDKREDEGHTKTVLDYATRLLNIVSADEKIVIPAVILHDLGWSQIKKEDWIKIFQDNIDSGDRRELRVKHEKEGVKLAREILESVRYDTALIKGILEIIDGHDTRNNYLSIEDGVVKDADKLSIFSKWGVEYDLRIRNIAPKDYLNILEAKLASRYKFYFEQSKQIALQELNDRKIEYRV